MTIGVGFVCGNGLVIGADRKVTNPDEYTFEEQKVDAIAWANGAAIWSYSGNPDTAKNVRAELQSRFAAHSTVFRRDIKKQIQEVLRACLNKGERFNMLYGAQTKNEAYILLMATTDKIAEVDKCEIIGGGDSSLSRYLRGLILNLPFPPLIDQAVIAATYIIQQAKRYDGHYCGGATDVYALDFDGFTHVTDQWQAERWERELKQLEFESAVLFATLTAKGVEEDRIENALKTHAEIVRQFCAKVRGS